MARNNQKDYSGLSRSVMVNRYKGDIDKRKKVRAQKGLRKGRFSLRDFLIENIWKWLEHAIRHLLGSKHVFQIYNGGDQGIYDLKAKKASGKITIALAADWATDTDESIAVASKMKSLDPDYTIHLGDTYYTGERSEIEDNFLLPDAPWHKGSGGSFALMGNHEMYSMANAYYSCLLPQMGIFDPIQNKYLGQQASFFCLTTSHWIIIGLDTGYNSVSFPYVWNTFRKNGQLPDGLIQWLKEKVKLQDEKRGILLLSHHQYVSAFCGEKNYVTPAEQLASIIGRSKSVIWIWGHEHRFAFYGKYQDRKGIAAFGRCMGHGGMPVELHKMKLDQSKIAPANLVAYDDRFRKQMEGLEIGWNGFANLTLENETLTISYFDTEDILLEEKWVANPETGMIKGKSVKLHDRGRNLNFVKPENEMIGD